MKSTEFRRYIKSLRHDAIDLPRYGYVCVEISSKEPMVLKEDLPGLKGHCVSTILSGTQKLLGVVMRASFKSRDYLIEKIRSQLTGVGTIKAVHVYHAPLPDMACDVMSYWAQAMRATSPSKGILALVDGSLIMGISNLDIRNWMKHKLNVIATEAERRTLGRKLVATTQRAEKASKPLPAPAVKDPVRDRLIKDAQELPEVVTITRSNSAKPRGDRYAEVRRLVKEEVLKVLLEVKSTSTEA